MDERMSDFESTVHLAVWIVGVGAVCAVVYLAIQIGFVLMRLYGFESTHRRNGWMSTADAGLRRLAA